MNFHEGNWGRLLENGEIWARPSRVSSNRDSKAIKTKNIGSIQRILSGQNKYNKKKSEAKWAL